MSAVALDVPAVRRRFPGLARPTAFLDGPGGSQVPDTVIEAMDAYLRNSNANLGGAFETSRRSDALVVAARETAARFLGCAPEEVGFGANMTTLNFALSRAVARDFRPGDEIVVTRLDHDGNVAPWLELARDHDLVVRFAGVHDDTTLDLDELERLVSSRTRVVAFPLASNAVGTIPDAARVVSLAHAADALAWIDAVHYAPHGPIDVAALDADVLLCSPYKFYGPHLGLFYGRAELLERLRPYKVRPAPDEPLAARFETGTLPHELLAGFVAAVGYVQDVGWDAIQAHERQLAERFLAGLPHGVELYGLGTPGGRTPTFAFTLPGRTPLQVASLLAERDIAVWSGDYYALEIMARLGLPDGAVRAGFLHYNTFDEVDRLLGELDRLAEPG